MERVLGPILYSEGCDDDTWRLRVAVLTDSEASTCPYRVDFEPKGACTVGAAEVAADLRPIGAGVYWSWPVEVHRDTRERKLRYRVRASGSRSASGRSGAGWIEPVRVPAKGELPRVAFFSCNGFSDAQTARDTPNPNALWEDVLDLHQRARRPTPQDAPPGFHLLLGGGDQLYADELWSTCPVLEPPALASHAEMLRAKVTPAQEREILAAYVALYVKRFSARPFADALARIPLAATWDDHDIFDGWGSYPRDLQRCDLFQAVFRCAQTSFDAFQLCGSRSSRVGGGSHRLQALTFACDDGALEVLLLDARSERTLSEVLTERQHRDIERWLGDTGSRLGQTPRRRHLLVVSSVPTLYMRFAPWMESVTEGFRPFHGKRIDDDMRDQWESHLHSGERNRLVMQLFAHARATASRVTIVSGDVYVGSRGRYRSTDPEHVAGREPQAVIEQLTCSGIVHPPPSWAAFLGMKTVAAHSRQVIAEHVDSELLPIAGFDYLRDRNWLSIAFDEAGPATRRQTRLWGQWRTEQGAVPEQAVVEAE